MSNDHFVFRDHVGNSVSIVVTGHVVRYSFQDGSYLELDGGSKNLTRYDSASAFHEVISLDPHQIHIWHTSAANLAILNKMRLHADATVIYEIHPDQGECNFVDGTVDCRPPEISRMQRPNLLVEQDNLHVYATANNCSYEWAKVHKPYIGHETYAGCVSWTLVGFAMTGISAILTCGTPTITVTFCAAAFGAFVATLGAAEVRGNECRAAKADADYALNQCLTNYPNYKRDTSIGDGGGYESPVVGGDGGGNISVGQGDICYRSFDHSEGPYYIIVDCR